jgi:hypothetical protein
MGLDPQNEIEAKITPITKERLRSALIEGHQTIRGGELPPRARLRFAWCQVCLEVSGGASSWQYNLGNIKTSAKDPWAGAWYKLPDEVLSEAVAEWPYQRGYGSPEQGATDYWRLMFAKFGQAIKAADTGDLRAAAYALRSAGYYTAPADRYATALEGWARQYDRTWPDDRPGGTLAHGVLGVAIVVSAILMERAL